MLALQARGPEFNPEPQVKLGHSLTCLQFQHWGKGAQQVPRACWSLSLPYLGKLQVGKNISKNKNGFKGTALEGVLAPTHMCTYMYGCTPTCTEAQHIHTRIYTHQETKMPLCCDSRSLRHLGESQQLDSIWKRDSSLAFQIYDLEEDGEEPREGFSKRAGLEGAPSPLRLAEPSPQTH